jgi:hypothetical protein
MTRHSFRHLFASRVALCLVGLFFVNSVRPCLGIDASSIKLLNTFQQAPSGDLGHYGQSTAIDGHIAVVGSSSSNYQNEPLSIYVYDFANPLNVIQRRLFYPGTNSNLLSEFGWSVAVSGNYVFVGAPNENNIGAVYMYDVSNLDHITYQRIVAYDMVANTAFGESLAVDGNRLLVGNPKYSAASTQAPAAYLLDFSNPNSITQRKIVRNPAARVGRFGETLDLDGDFAIIGDWGDNTAGSFTGSAYIYDLRDTTNSTSKQVVAQDAAFTNNFGLQVAISGKTALVQADGDLGPVILAGNRTGVVYSHDFTSFPSVTQTEFGIAKTSPSPAFGRAVEMDANLAVIVASGVGQTFLYDLSHPASPQQLAILPTAGAWSAGIDGNHIIVAGNGFARLYELVPEPSPAAIVTIVLLAAPWLRWTRHC